MNHATIVSVQRDALPDFMRHHYKGVPHIDMQRITPYDGAVLIPHEDDTAGTAMHPPAPVNHTYVPKPVMIRQPGPDAEPWNAAYLPFGVALETPPTTNRRTPPRSACAIRHL